MPTKHELRHVVSGHLDNAVLPYDSVRQPCRVPGRKPRTCERFRPRM